MMDLVIIRAALKAEGMQDATVEEAEAKNSQWYIGYNGCHATISFGRVRCWAFGYVNPAHQPNVRKDWAGRDWKLRLARDAASSLKRAATP